MPWRVSTIVLIRDGQFATVIIGVVLYQRINHSAVGGEIGNHVGHADNDLTVEDVVIGIVALVHHKGEVDHESCRVAMTVGAGVGFVGRHAVKGQKLGVAHAVNDDTSAGAFHIGGDVNPPTDRIQGLILHRVWINRNRIGENGPIGILRALPAPMQEGQERY